MIEDFPVGDSLHLIDLGIMKKLLSGWLNGSFGNYRIKWSTKEITLISNFLKHVKMPVEMHRSVRALDVLAFWKGTEFRTFLHYLSVVILKEVLPADVFKNFLMFFCAITICSSNMYSHFLDLAQQFLNNFIELFRDIYGEDYLSSNVHNLSHLVDEVKRFGILSTFNAYPFENKLFEIKRLLRTGTNPLAQVANRLSERIKFENFNHPYKDTHKKFPLFLKQDAFHRFRKVQFKNFILTSEEHNCWFLTNNIEVVQMEYCIQENGVYTLVGNRIMDLENIFEYPIKSSFLNIFKSKCKVTNLKKYLVTDIKCKLVSIHYNDKVAFIPLLHTL